MKLVEAPYGERVDREVVQGALEEMRMRLTDMLEPHDATCCDDEPHQASAHVLHLVKGSGFHTWCTEGTIVDVLNQLENALARLGVDPS